jgi:hypothetical protein
MTYLVSLSYEKNHNIVVEFNLYWFGLFFYWGIYTTEGGKNKLHIINV